jgi:hypothetical protein
MAGFFFSRNIITLMVSKKELRSVASSYHKSVKSVCPGICVGLSKALDQAEKTGDKKHIAQARKVVRNAVDAVEKILKDMEARMVRVGSLIRQSNGDRKNTKTNNVAYMAAASSPKVHEAQAHMVPLRKSLRKVKARTYSTPRTPISPSLLAAFEELNAKRAAGQRLNLSKYAKAKSAKTPRTPKVRGKK